MQLTWKTWSTTQTALQTNSNTQSMSMTLEWLEMACKEVKQEEQLIEWRSEFCLQGTTMNSVIENCPHQQIMSKFCRVSCVWLNLSLTELKKFCDVTKNLIHCLNEKCLLWLLLWGPSLSERKSSFKSRQLGCQSRSGQWQARAGMGLTSCTNVA